MQTFKQLGVSDTITDELARTGISQPTPVQEQAIPVLLDGRDALIESMTGTGKTLAYLLPIIQRIDVESSLLQAVVVVPTRELAMQVHRESERFGGIRSQALIGGAAIERQIDRLKLKPHIVVGTPGRIQELIKLRKLKMHAVKTIVVDEADQVINLGSTDELDGVIRSAMRDRQLVFCSATITPETAQTAQKWMQIPARIAADTGQRTPPLLEHIYFVCEERDKIEMLRKIIRHLNPKAAIIFLHHTDNIGEVAAKLDYLGFTVGALYSDAPKQDRTTVLNAFRTGKFPLLVTTDVGARGLDVEQITHVIHYDPPSDADQYVHRVGRTARMGRKGTAISLVAPNQMYVVHKLEKRLGITIAPKGLIDGRIVDDPVKKGKAAARSKQLNRAGSATDIVTRSKPSKLDGEGFTRTKKIDRMEDRAIRDGDVTLNKAGERSASKPERDNVAKTSNARTGTAKSSNARAGSAKNDRVKDRKNKGAPRWLKEKSNPPRQ